MGLRVLDLTTHTVSPHHLPQVSHRTPEGSPVRDGRCHGWKQVTDEARESPVRFLEHSPLEGAAEALRSQSRGSQRVLEVYSPSILKLVRSLVFPTSTSSVPPPGPRGRGSGHRPVYLEFLIVTVLVTLGRQSSCRVGLRQNHAHRILVQPVQAGLLVQEPWRRTRPQGSLPRQRFLHYFSEEVSRGERGIRTAENTPTHSGE
jgi:hypothetical protein